MSLAVEVSENGEGVRVRYPFALGADSSHLRDRDSVLLEFGGRNTTLPNEQHRVTPYAAVHTESLEFPVAEVVVLSPRRTFWEKATLIHAEWHRPRRPPGGGGAERSSRHWYDLARLARQEIGEVALKDGELLAHVVKLKGISCRSGFANYPVCLKGNFCLVPDEPLRIALERDFSAMVNEGMFFEPPGSFPTILEELHALEATLNRSQRFRRRNVGVEADRLAIHPGHALDLGRAGPAVKQRLQSNPQLRLPDVTSLDALRVSRRFFETRPTRDLAPEPIPPRR